VELKGEFDDGSFWNLGHDEQQRITDVIEAISDRRAVIDQAKGMLMLLHGIDSDQAFKLLQWQSQEHNAKLRDLAVQVVADYRAMSDDDLPARAVYNRRFLTAHSRLARKRRDPATDR